MVCNKCGSAIGENMMFCSACGARVGGEPVQAQPTQPMAQDYQAPPAYVQNNANNYGAFAPAPQGGQPVGAKKSSLPKWLIPAVGGAVAVILVVVLAVVFLGGGASDKFFKAFKKTLFETQSASVDINGEYDELEFQFSIGKGVDELKVYAYDGYEGAGIKDGCIYIDGDVYSIEELVSDELEGDIYGYQMPDIMGLVNDLLNNKIDEKTFEDIYNTQGREIIENLIKYAYVVNLSPEERDPYINVTGMETEILFDKVPVDVEIPDYNQLMNHVQALLKKGVKDGAITIEKDGDSYSYSINLVDGARCLLEYVENEKDLNAILETLIEVNGMTKSEFLEEINEEIDYAEGDGLGIAGEFKIEGGYIVYLDANGTEEGYDDFELFEVKISDIGSTTVSDSKIESAGY